MNAAHLEFCASDDWREIVEQLILPAALSGVELGTDLVEIGPGPGFTTDVLRDRVERLTAVELDAELADALARRLEGSNVRVLHGDATALDLPRDTFTAAASFNMLHHVPDDVRQDQIFGELARVLCPDGVLVAADSVASEELRAFHERDTYHPIDPGGLPGRLRTAGFTAIDVRTYSLGWLCTARVA